MSKFTKTMLGLGLTATLAGGCTVIGVTASQKKSDEVIKETAQIEYEKGFEKGITINQGYTEEEMQAVRDQLEQTQNQISALQSIINQKDGDIETLNTLVSELENKKTELETRITELENQLNNGGNQENPGENPGSGEEIVSSAGLYVGDELQTSWNDLISSNYIAVDDQGVLTAGSAGTTSLSGKLVIDENVKSIGSKSFMYSQIEEVVIPEGVTSIGSSAFNKCPNLQKVIMADSIEEIGASAFYGCSLLNDLTLPQNLKTIGNTAFIRCDLLISQLLSSPLILPSTLETIGSKIYGENEIFKVYIPSSVTSIQSSSFGVGVTAYFESSDVDTSLMQFQSVVGVSKETFNNIINILNKNLLLDYGNLLVYQDDFHVDVFDVAENSTNIIYSGFDANSLTTIEGEIISEERAITDRTVTSWYKFDVESRTLNLVFNFESHVVSHKLVNKDGSSYMLVYASDASNGKFLMINLAQTDETTNHFVSETIFTDTTPHNFKFSWSETGNNCVLLYDTNMDSEDKGGIYLFDYSTGSILAHIEDKSYVDCSIENFETYSSITMIGIDSSDVYLFTYSDNSLTLSNK